MIEFSNSASNLTLPSAQLIFTGSRSKRTFSSVLFSIILFGDLTDGVGCIGMDTVNVTVNSIPVVVASNDTAIQK